MAEELVGFQVFSTIEQFPAATVSPEIDLPQVPLGQTWRVDRLTALLIAPNWASISQPIVLVYDQASPGPAVPPADISVLSLYTGEPPNLAPGWFLDVDDCSAPITIQGGNQLAVVFPRAGAVTCGVRVQYTIYQGLAGKAQPAASLVPSPSIAPGL